MDTRTPPSEAATIADLDEARRADDDLAALTRVLLGVEADQPQDTGPTGADGAVQDGRQAQQRRQRLLEELSFLDE